MIRVYDIPHSKITEKTISEIHKLIKETKKDYDFRNLIVWIVKYKGVQAKDSIGELKAVYDSFKKIIHYFFDTYQIELLQSPWRVLETLSGDCDCTATLMASSTGVLGYSYRLITVKADLERPNEWSHIWAEAQIPKGDWIPMDLTVKEFSFGQRVPRIYEEKIWNEPIY